ncbi:MAG: GIY-YIG nuclease family protein, partial [Methyloligellaceae bacterium]
ALPQLSGAYVLTLAIECAFPLAIRTLPATRMRPGVYLYCGSAYGPGGLRARLARHFRAEKAPRWHIDRLTCRAAKCAALIVPGGNECNLADTLRSRSDLDMPIPRFGASDCRRCESHLFCLKA